MILNFILQGPIRMLLPPHVNYVVDQAGDGLLGKLHHKDPFRPLDFPGAPQKFPRSKNFRHGLADQQTANQRVYGRVTNSDLA